MIRGREARRRTRAPRRRRGRHRRRPARPSARGPHAGSSGSRRRRPPPERVCALGPALQRCLHGGSRTGMNDPVFLITGASSGIGAASARAAAEAGYRVVLSARRTEPLENLAAELGGPERALAVRCDVTEFGDQQELVARALDHFGRVDVAFANAGFGAARGFLEESPEHWRSMVLTNVYGVALTIRAAMPAVREARGHFVLTGSVAGRRALPGSLYSATKWAVTAMGESLRQELNDSGVRVTVIEPGMVDTPFFSRGTPDDVLKADDVARAVMFAVSQPPHVDVNEILIRPTAQSN